MNAAYQTRAGSPTRKAVLVALANMADHRGSCFPSISYISRITEISERTVRRCLRELEESGHLETKPRSDKHGQKSNLYVIRAVTLTGGEDTVTPTPRSYSAKPPVTVTPRTVFNNHIEHIGAEAEFADWLEVLKKKKAATAPKSTAWTRRLNTLSGLSANPNIQKSIIAQSADKGWSDLYPLKDTNDGNKRQGANRPESAHERSQRIIRERTEALKESVNS